MKVWIPECSAEFDQSSRTVIEGYTGGFRSLGVDVVCSTEPPDDIAERVQFQWVPYFTYFRPEPRALKRVLATLFDWTVLPPSHQVDLPSIVNQAELVVVASTEAKRTMEIHGADCPVIVMPLGVDSDMFSFAERDFTASPFVFAHISPVLIRKGSDLLLRAFIEAFPSEPDVRLLIHGSVYDHLEYWTERLSSDERIVFNTEHFATQLELVAAVYHRAHILVAPSLSDGFGLTVFEALATGIPAIVSRGCAFTNWFTERLGWFVEPSLQEFPVGRLWAGVFGHWRIPSLTSLVDAMRTAYESRDECAMRGRMGAEWVRKTMTWDSVTAPLATRMEEL